MIRFLMALAAALALASCSEPDSIKVQGEVAGQPTMNIYFKHYAHGAVRQGVVLTEKGKFAFETAADAPGLLILHDNEGKTLGTLYMAPGDQASVSITRGNQFLMRAKGSEINEAWSKAANAAADSLIAGGRAANRAVEAFAASNPASIPAAIMFASAYDASIDPLRADSVLAAIAESPQTQIILDGWTTAMSRYSAPGFMAPIDTLAYRTRKADSAVIFTPTKPATLIVFSSLPNQRRDSLRRQMSELSDRKELEIIDIMLCSDTIAWKNAVKIDTVNWTQAWMPGGIYASVVDRLALPQIPYRIVIDSLGQQAYRGASHDGAKAAIDSLLRKKAIKNR